MSMIDTVLNIYYFTKLRDWVEFGHWVGPFIRLNLYIYVKGFHVSFKNF